MASLIPKHWNDSSWEEKARENPLFAVMTVGEFADAESGQFSQAALDAFFAKGEAVFDTHIRPHAPAPCRMFEYGCGMGRIMKAAMAAGHSCAGADISPTMLGHGRTLLGDGPALHLVGADGAIDAESGAFDLVYSYAVLQHIAKLSIYRKALAETMRLLRPGGTFVLQINCEDFSTDPPERTENSEDHSVHISADGRQRRRHNQTNWSGVYIGYDLLAADLASHGCVIDQRYAPKKKKPRLVWVTGRKT